MPFQTLRNNSQFIILHKEQTPYVETGLVTNVTTPVPRFTSPMFGQPQEMIVDVTVKVGEQNFTFQKLPANMDIADFGNNGNIVVSCSRDAMNAEVTSMKQKSIDHVNSLDYHKDVIAGCDKILEVLNPEFAEKQKQEKELSTLKGELANIKDLLAQLVASGVQLPEEKRQNNNNNNNNKK